jgi:hypothetical protein
MDYLTVNDFVTKKMKNESSAEFKETNMKKAKGNEGLNW